MSYRVPSVSYIVVQLVTECYLSNIAVQLATESYLSNIAIQLAMYAPGCHISLAECKSPEPFLVMQYYVWDTVWAWSFVGFQLC